MCKKYLFFVLVVILGLFYFGCESVKMPTESQVVNQDLGLKLTAESIGLPAGADLQSATFYIYVNIASGQDIFIHRITSDWMEYSVTWNSFGGNYDGTVIGSFIPVTTGWYSVDITSLVEAWFDGSYPNYGILLRQNHEANTAYFSSEYDIPERRPKLIITYNLNGSTEEITIQRGFYGDVFDALINEGSPETNYGSGAALVTRNLNNLEKQSLLKFGAPTPPSNPGTGTPGYWMNHPEAWPVEEISIGEVDYTKSEAIGFMKEPVKKDKLYTMFPALVAAKLNVLIGNDASCISNVISEADIWMTTYGPIGINTVLASSMAWTEGEPLYWELDDYNNGLLCAPSRD